MAPQTSTGRQPIAVFFGGVVPAGERDAKLAYEVGRSIGRAGFVLRHGGYNGLMEHAAQGARESGADVVAVSHQGMDWGSYNSHVTQTVLMPDMGSRLMYFLDDADLVVAMAGGVGTLHELSAAIWYAGNVRQFPVLLLGGEAHRLVQFLRRHRWLFESPTRPLGFLNELDTARDFDACLARLVADPTDMRA
jgi:uncharacterized protein (TIGR00725 family)